MATKTISIDMKAYERLKAIRRPNESFSDAIKRVIVKPVSVEEWMRDIQKLKFSDKFLDAVESIVADRRRPSRTDARRRAAS